MENFTFYAPTYFDFGKGAEAHAGALVKRFQGSRVLIHFGGGSAVKSGLIGRVEKSLQDEGLAVFKLGGVKPNPRSGLVYEGIEMCRREKIDFILAVGGGSVIDSAKAIAVGVPYAGDFWDFYENKCEVKAALPVATVLTIAAAGSEGSPDSVITHEPEMYKRAIGTEFLRPKFSILNPELTETLPPYQSACGITDIMAHLFERYMTNTKNVETTDRMIEGLLLAMISEGPKVIANPHDYEARANIMWAGMMAHNNSCGVGRGQDWASHDIEHELSAAYDCAHGAGLAVIMPAVMTYNLKHDVMRFAQAAVRVWGCQMDFDHPEITALNGIEAFRTFLKRIGMPSKLSEVGGREEDLKALAHKACFGDFRTGTIGGFVPLKETDVEAIYRLAL